MEGFSGTALRKVPKHEVRINQGQKRRPDWRESNQIHVTTRVHATTRAIVVMGVSTARPIRLTASRSRREKGGLSITSK